MGQCPCMVQIWIGIPERGCDNMVADVLSWVTTWLNPDAVRSILEGVTLGTVHQAKFMPCCSWGWSLLGTGDTCHCRLCTCTNACYWLGWSPERGPNVECSIELAEGTEEARFEGTSGQTHLQWRRQAYLMESAEFYNLSWSLVLVLNAQRWDWRSSTLCGPQGPVCHHLEWVPLRCGPTRVWLYPVCYGSVSGGQVWPLRCSSLSSPVHDACSMRAICPKHLYTQLWPSLCWTSCM